MKIGVVDRIVKVDNIFGERVYYEGASRPSLRLSGIKSGVLPEDIESLKANDWHIFDDDVTDEEIYAFRERGWEPEDEHDTRLLSVQTGYNFCQECSIVFISADPLEVELSRLRKQLALVEAEKADAVAEVSRLAVEKGTLTAEASEKKKGE